MKRYIVAIIIAFGMSLLLGAHDRTSPLKVVKKNCKGYSVIEVDKGIDCNGDTIRLVKIHGFFERAPMEESKEQIDS